MSANDQSSDVTTGCCIGQSWMAADGFGLPKRSRAAAVTALTGFQSAMTRTTVGMRSVGTSALETNASGKRTIRPEPLAPTRAPC